MNNLLDDEQIKKAGNVVLPIARDMMNRDTCPFMQSALTYASIVFLHRLANEMAPYDPDFTELAVTTKHALQNIVDDIEEQGCLNLS